VVRPSSAWTSRQPWAPGSLPPGFERAFGRLRDRVIARVAPDGAVRSRCRSRVLESVLAARLFARVGLHSEHRHRVVEYLYGARAAASPLEVALIDIALHGAGEIPMCARDDLVTRAPEFTGARKRAFFDACLALCDVRPEHPLDVAAFRLDGLHCWATVQVTSAKVVLAAQAGRWDLISDEDARILLATQECDGIWEGNVLLHLWALHALDRLPGTRDTVAAGVEKLLAHQRVDGGFPFVTDTDTWCTATAGMALLSAGAPTSVLNRIAGHLERQQQPAGGWSYTDDSRQTDVDDTSVAVQFLHSLNPVHHAAAIERGVRSLCAVRGGDGGFPTYVAGAASEAAMTVAVLDALTTDRARHERTINAGLDFLYGQQCRDGAFPPDWSASRFHTLARALLMMSRTGGQRAERVRRMTERAITLTTAQQNGDGGWGQQTGDPSDAVSTAYALIALCGQDSAAPIARGIDYLLAHQRSDGSIASISDSIGPRPFIFTVPALADIFPLLAMAHVAGRVAATVTASRSA